MNQFILIAMNRKNRTRWELEAAFQAVDKVDSTFLSAIYHSYNFDKGADIWADRYFEYWIDSYFELTGEDRSEYEQEIKT